MEDKISKKVFENVLNAKLTGDFSFYEQIKSDDEYFDPEVVRLTDRETFLNIGAFRGNDILEFAKKTSGNYEKIIGFEPDSKTAVELKERLEANRIERVEIYNIGAWSDHDTLAFDSFVGGSSQLASDKAISLDNYVVEVNAIDNILGTTPVTYLQMDIEGAEYNALLGAENTIKRDVPKMAISVYHRREDLFKLPLLVHSFVPSYRFYLRHYTDIQTETVLYCLNS
jgi:FkbM family methyltransferase